MMHHDQNYRQPPTQTFAIDVFRALSINLGTFLLNTFYVNLEIILLVALT